MAYLTLVRQDNRLVISSQDFCMTGSYPQIFFVFAPCCSKMHFLNVEGLFRQVFIQQRVLLCLINIAMCAPVNRSLP